MIQPITGEDREVDWLRDATAYVLDDDRAARESCVCLLQSMGLDARAYASPTELFNAWSTGNDRRGVLLLDIRLEGMNGLQLLRELTVVHKMRFPVVVLTGHADIDMVLTAFRLGAYTVVEKPYQEQILWDAAVRSLKQSYRAVAFCEQFDADDRCLAELSPQDRRLAERLASGETTASIAKEFMVSTRAIQQRRQRILDELDAENVLQLTELFARHEAARHTLAREAVS